jgi:hypothetical protein
MLPQRRRARIASPACPVPPETAAHARSSIACTNARNNSIALDDYWPWTPDIKKDVGKVWSRLLGSVLFWRQCGHLSSHAANDPPHIANPMPRVSHSQRLAAFDTSVRMLKANAGLVEDNHDIAQGRARPEREGAR